LWRGHDFSRNNNNLRIEKESKALLQIIIQGISSYEFVEGGTLKYKRKIKSVFAIVFGCGNA
jgi:hypothetical protein